MKEKLQINRIGRQKTNFTSIYNYLRNRRLGQFVMHLNSDNTTLLCSAETANVPTISVPADVLPILEVLSLVMKDPKNTTKPFLSKENNAQIAEAVTTTLAKIKTGLPMNRLNSGMFISLLDIEKKLAACWAALSDRLLSIFSGDSKKAAAALATVKSLFTVTLYEAKLLNIDTDTEVALAIRDIPSYDYVPRKSDLTYDHIYIELVSKLHEFYSTSANEEIKKIAIAMNQSLSEWRNASNKKTASLHANEVYIYVDNLSKVMAQKLTEFTNEIGKIDYTEVQIDQVLSLIAYYLDDEANDLSKTEKALLYKVNYSAIDASSRAIIEKYAHNPYIVGMIVNEVSENKLITCLDVLLGHKSGPSTLINTICETFDKIFTSEYSRFRLCSRSEAIKHINIKCFKNQDGQNRVVLATKDKFGVGYTQIETYTWSSSLSADSSYSLDPNASIVYRTSVNEENLGVLKCYDEINLALANGMQSLLHQNCQELANTNMAFTYVIMSGLSELDIMNLGYYFSDQLFIDLRDLKIQTYGEHHYNIKRLENEDRVLCYYKADLPTNYDVETDLDCYDEEIKQYTPYIVTLDINKLIAIKAVDHVGEPNQYIIPDEVSDKEVSFNLANYLHYNRNRSKLVAGDQFFIKFKDKIFNTGDLAYECKLSDIINITQYLTFETNLVVHEYNKYLQHKTKENYLLINLIRAELASSLLWNTSASIVNSQLKDYDSEVTTIKENSSKHTKCSLKLVDEDKETNEFYLDDILPALSRYCHQYERSIYVGSRPSLNLTDLSDLSYKDEYSSFFRQIVGRRDAKGEMLDIVINQLADYIDVEENRTINFFIATFRVVIGNNTAIRTIGSQMLNRIAYGKGIASITSKNSAHFKYQLTNDKLKNRIKAQLTNELDTIALQFVFGICDDLDTFMYSTANTRSTKAFLSTLDRNFHLSLLSQNILADSRFKIWSLADTDIFEKVKIDYVQRFKFVDQAKMDIGLAGRFSENLLKNLMQNSPRGQRKFKQVNTYHQNKAQLDEVEKLNSIQTLNPSVKDVLDLVFKRNRE